MEDVLTLYKTGRQFLHLNTDKNTNPKTVKCILSSLRDKREIETERERWRWRRRRERKGAWRKEFQTVCEVIASFNLIVSCD